MFYSLIGSLGPNLHFNDGMRDVVRLNFAPRTIVNAEPPAPVSNYQMVNLKLVDVILEALAHSVPSARSPMPARARHASPGERRAAGPANLQYEIVGSAYGGGIGHDGTTATATHSQQPAHHADRDSRNRVSLPHQRVRPGAGFRRRRPMARRLALRREYELLEDATVIRRFNKASFPPNGVAAARPAAAAASSSGSAPSRNAKRRPRPASR